MKKFLKPLVCLLAFATLSIGNVANAKTSTDKSKLVAVSSISGQADGLSTKESIEKFIKENPESKEEALKILKDNNALNADGSIKDDLGQASTTTSKTLNSALESEAISTSNSLFLGTGYKYTLASQKQVDSPSLYGEIVWEATNTTNAAIDFQITETYSKSVSVSSTASIGSTAALSSAFSATTGYSLTYSQTWSAQQQYGATINVPAKTTAIIKVNPIYKIYTYTQQYYICGNKVGSSKTVDVYLPIAPHWVFSQKSI